MDSAGSAFVLQTVYGRISPAQRDEVCALWIEERALPPAEAERRAAEVLFLIRDAVSGDLAGVSTIYRERLPPGTDRYWFLRMFVRRESRGLSGLVSLPPRVLEAAFAHLAEPPRTDPDCRGVAVVAENAKLRSPLVLEHWLLDLPGWRLTGHDAGGRPIIRRDFDPLPAAGVMPAAERP